MVRRLRAAGFSTVGAVLAVEPEQLVGVPGEKAGVWGFGEAALAELCRALASGKPAGPPVRKLSNTERARLKKAVELVEEYASCLPEGYRVRLSKALEA